MTYKTYRLKHLRPVALVSLLLSLAFAGMIAASPASAAPPAASFYGVSETVASTNAIYKWDRIATTGAKTVRLGLNWKRDFYGGASAVSCPSSPLPSSPINWNTIDDRVRQAAIRGIEILPYLTGSFCSQGYPEPGSVEMTDWQTFVDDLGDRYGPGGTFWVGDWDGTPSTYTAVPINTWEVGNEPNLPQNNPGGTVDPQKYGKYLILTSTAIKGSQPAAKVLMGGLTTTVGGSTSVSDFLDDVYNPNPSYPCCVYTASQLNSAYDGLSLHPYALASDGNATVTHIGNARTALNGETSAFGADKPIWVTEFGWPLANNIVADCSSTSTVSVDTGYQRVYAAQAMSWMIANHDLAANLKLASWQSTVNSDAKCGTGPEVDPANYGVDYSMGKMGLTGPATLIQSHTPTFCYYVSLTSAPDCVLGPTVNSSPKLDQGAGGLANSLVAWVNYANNISYCSFVGNFTCADLPGSSATASTDPGVSVDPTTGAAKIIYRAANGQLGVVSRSSWSGSFGAPTFRLSAGDIATGTSPGVYRVGNSGAGTLLTDVVWRNASTGQLMHTAETIFGWIGVSVLGTGNVGANSSPAFYREAGGATMAVFRDPLGRLGYTYWNGSGWTTVYRSGLLAVDINSSPTIARNPTNGHEVIAYRTASDKLANYTYNGSTWTNNISTQTIPSDADPSVVVDQTAGTFFTVVRNPTDGITRWDRSAGGTWNTPSAITTISPPVVPLKVAPGTDPVASLTNSGSGPEYFVPFTDGAGGGFLQRTAFLLGDSSAWSVPIAP